MSQGIFRGVRRSTKIRERGISNMFQTRYKVQRWRISQIIEKVLNLDLETSPFRFGYLQAFLLVHRFWKHLEAQLPRVLQKIRFVFCFQSLHDMVRRYKESTSQRKIPNFGFVNIRCLFMILSSLSFGAPLSFWKHLKLEFFFPMKSRTSRYDA